MVEAGVKGGALITAARGLDQGRLVLAVPGDIDRATSFGCNLLIRDGAHPVLDIDELITSLTFVLGPPPNQVRHRQDPIVGLLADGPRSVEEISAEIGCPVGEALSRVTALEIDGVVTTDRGRVLLVDRCE